MVVSDGRLTISPGPSAANTKICFIEITDDLTSPILPSPITPDIGREVTMGTNLDGLAYWSTISPFIDVTAQFNSWSSNLNAPMSADAYPAPVNSLNYPTGDAAAVTYASGYPTGDYAVSYKGTGTVTFSRWSTYTGQKIEDLAFTPVTGSDGTKTGMVHLEIPAQLEAWYFAITITVQDSGDPIRDLHVISPDANPARSTIFRPIFLDKLAVFDGPLRVMDWMQTVGSTVSKWSDRPQLGRFSYYPSGVPYELWIDLANTLDKDLWINIPHLATQDSYRQPVVKGYVTLMAELLRDTLDPTLKIFVEYSNECWNSSSYQGSYVYNAASMDQELTKTDALGRAAEEFGKLTVNKVSIPFKNVFGAQRFAGQVRPVLGGFIVTNYWADSALGFIKHKWGDPSQYISGVGICPYVGGESDMGSVNSPDLTLDGLFAWMNNWLDNTLGQWIWYNKYTADQWEIPLLAYEGGQHLSYLAEPANAAVKTAAQEDPRMAEFYRRLLRTWLQYGGGIFENFSLAAKYSPYGFFGVLKSIMQSDSTRYAVVRELSTAAYWFTPDQAEQLSSQFSKPPVYSPPAPVKPAPAAPLKPVPAKSAAPKPTPSKSTPSKWASPQPVKKPVSKPAPTKLIVAPSKPLLQPLFSKKKLVRVFE